MIIRVLQYTDGKTCPERLVNKINDVIRALDDLVEESSLGSKQLDLVMGAMVNVADASDKAWLLIKTKRGKDPQNREKRGYENNFELLLANEAGRLKVKPV